MYIFLIFLIAFIFIFLYSSLVVSSRVSEDEKFDKKE